MTLYDDMISGGGFVCVCGNPVCINDLQGGFTLGSLLSMKKGMSKSSRLPPRDWTLVLEMYG
jgi:hypothetical protein